MKQLIESYQRAYQKYKGDLYIKLLYLSFIFGVPLIPTIIYYNVSLFVTILFWIFFGIMLIILMMFLALALYTTERPLYEYLYKEILDMVFKDDYTPFEYESFPMTNDFIEDGQLLNHLVDDVVRYRLTYYYLNQRIDLYSIYGYSKLHKSNKLSFNGIYFVIHNNNQNHFEIRTKGRLKRQHDDLALLESHEKYDIYLRENDQIPDHAKKTFLETSQRFESPVYMRGIDGEIHMAIDHLFDDLKAKDLTEEKLNHIKDQLSMVIQFGKDLYKKLSD